VFLEYPVCPDAELGAAQGFDSIANRNYDIKIVMFYRTLNLSFSLFLNRQVFLDS